MSFSFGRKLDVLSLGLVLPIGVNVIVYFGYVTAYTQGAFSRQGFLHQYLDGIYKYRVLGRWALLGVHSFLVFLLPKIGYGNLKLDFIPFIDKDGDPIFYLSYFLLNTAFFVLTSFGLISLLKKAAFDLSDSEKRLRALVIMVLIALTEFVVVPYDMISYFFLVAGCYATIRYFESLKLTAYLGILICVILGTLTRETGLLSISAFAMLASFSPRFSIHRAKLAILIGAFGFTYTILRFAYGFHHALFDLLSNATVYPIRNAIGLLIAVGFGYLLIRNSAEWQRAKIFLLFSIPYLFGVVLFGSWYEIRLFVPLLLLLSILLPLRHLQYRAVSPEEHLLRMIPSWKRKLARPSRRGSSSRSTTKENTEGSSLTS